MERFHAQALDGTGRRARCVRVLHVIPSISTGEGGPSAAIRLMSAELKQAGVDVHVATTDDDGPRQRLDVAHGTPVQMDGMTVFFFPKQLQFYKISLPFSRWLDAHVHEYDLVHIHALFSFTSVVAARIAFRHRVPYIIRPLGLLNSYGMTQRRPWLKSLSMRWLDGPALARAACVHFTSHEEQHEASMTGLKMRPAVIPLGIDLTPFESPADPRHFLAQFNECNNRTIILFMSRLDPTKGMEILLDAFVSVLASNPSARLVVAGKGDAAYESSLRERADRLGISSEITWTGFISGTLKLSAFAAASVYVLPSFSENFGIAAVEALAAGLPCILSEHVAIASTQVRQADAGIVTACDANALTTAINKVLTDSDLRATLGNRARALAFDQFSARSMGLSLVALYEEIAKSPKSGSESTPS